MGGKDSRVWGHKCSCISEVREKDRTRRGRGKLALEGKRGRKRVAFSLLVARQLGIRVSHPYIESLPIL